MADVFEITATEDSPKIEFNKTAGTLHISGKSLPEDAFTFYQTALEWLNSYTLHAPQNTTAEVKLEYFNTASSKQIFKILTLLKELSKTKSVSVKWFYDKGDKDMKLSGERFSKLCELPLELIEN